MTKQTATTLLRKAQSDKGIWKRIDDAKTLEEVVAVGAEVGCEFTVGELQEVLEEIRVAELADLTEDELGGVAGGREASLVVQRNLGVRLPRSLRGLMGSGWV